MPQAVSYENDGSISIIRIDDGRVNALSPDLLRDFDRAVDQAERDGLPLMLIGRPGVLSGGFDLDVMRKRGVAAWIMILRGFRLAVRLLTHPHPVVVACTGHAIAMGSFLLLSGDVRVGARGAYKIQANEVAVGMTLPYTALALCTWRLSPNELGRATLMSRPYSPDDAVPAGFLDLVVDEAEIETAARQQALEAAELPGRAHAQTKWRARSALVRRLRWTILRDAIDLAWVGVRSASRQLVGRGR